MKTTSRRGYTLIEMLIASVLVGSLMAVCFGLMSMYSQFLAAGQKLATEQQPIRSVVQMLEDDLQKVTIPDSIATARFQTRAIEAQASDVMSPSTALNAPDESLSLGEGESGMSAFEESEVSGILPETPLDSVPGVISLAGNSNAIRLNVQFNPGESVSPKPGEPGDYRASASEFSSEVQSAPAAEEGIAPRVDELQTIIWQFHPWGQLAVGPQQLEPGLYRIQAGTQDFQIAMRAADTLLESPGTGDSVAISQVTLDALQFPTMTRETQESAVAEPMAISGQSAPSVGQNGKPLIDVIPEVAGCRFEYFSGSVWESSWDSELRAGLPVAVRVRLRLLGPEHLAGLRSQMGVTGAAAADDVSTRTGATRPVENLTSSPPAASNTFDSAPQSAIPVREVQRTFLLQPITGAMPLPEDSDWGPTESSSTPFPPQARQIPRVSGAGELP